MEQITKLIRSDYIYKLADITPEVECNIPIPDYAFTELTNSASVIITSTEALNGECVVRGKVNFKIITRTESGLNSLDYFADFESRARGNVLPTTKVLTRATVCDVAATTAGGKIAIVATLCIALYGISTQETPAIVGLDTACVLDGQTPTSALVGVYESRVSLFDEFDAGRTTSVILTGSAANITDVSIKKGTIKALGEAVAKVAYTTESGTYVHTFSVPFVEEIACERADGCAASASACVDNVRLTLSGTEDDTEIKAEIAVIVRADVWNHGTETVVADAYSTETELELCECKKRLSYPVATCKISEDVKKTFALANGLTPIDKVVGTVAEWNTTTQATPACDTINIEGVISGAALYQDKDGTLCALPYELPYSFCAPCQGVRESCVVLVDGAIMDTSAYLRGDSEIEISCRLTCSVCIYRGEQSFALISCKEGQIIGPSPYPLTVRFGVAGATEWQTAKELKIEPDRLVQMNPNLTFPLKGGEKIVQYRPIDID